MLLIQITFIAVFIRQNRNPKAAGSFTKKEYSTETHKRKRNDKNGSYEPRKFSSRGNTIHRKNVVKHSGGAKSTTERPSQGGFKRKNTNFKTDKSGGKRQKQ